MFGFVNAARRLRGLLAIVERQGPIAVGDSFKIIPSPTRRGAAG